MSTCAAVPVLEVPPFRVAVPLEETSLRRYVADPQIDIKPTADLGTDCRFDVVGIEGPIELVRNIRGHLRETLLLQ